ncbi:5-formyltetrahydrofolate cyclo-ligase [Thermodesulfobacteriota bacterium]
MPSYSTRKDKINLRKEILEKRDSLNIAEIKDKSFDIKKKLFNLKEFKEATNIMFYVSFRSEVMTDFMIKEALEIGKKVIAPKSDKSKLNLKIYYLTDFYTELTFGTYGILEPMADKCARAKKDDIDIVIVPGAAFSEAGDRIGYGAGYYDRFFEHLPASTPKIALSYELQLVEKVPSAENDVKMDMIITEERGIRCK